MAKKRLSDMLRQEVEKPTDVLDVEAKPVEESQNYDLSASNGDQIVNLVVATPTDNGANATITNLEATIAELKKSLEEAQKREKKLHDKINDLQTDLKEQKDSAKKLQKDLEQSNNTKAELTEVKKAALHLAETNSKLIEEIDNLKKPQETPKSIVPQQTIKSIVPQETSKSIVSQETSKPIVPRKTQEKRFQTFAQQATSSSTSDLGYLD